MVGIVLMHRSSPLFRLTFKRYFPFFYYNPGNVKNVYSKSADKKLEECYQTLQIPKDSKQDLIREAYLSLAKRYHPDSGSADANKEKFVALENAFRTLCKHHDIIKDKKDTEATVFDIKHTAPQHRQYLSFEGIGHGTPFQRQKQWTKARAEKAANNVMEHKISKAIAADNTLMVKGSIHSKKHDIKTNQGFDRLVEDLILESMSKGEFNNLKGKGKPLEEQNRNPYVDFVTHKLNEVLINNGFTPGWITMSKEINESLELLKCNLRKERKYLGPYPLNVIDTVQWEKICEEHKHSAKELNKKINEYNLIVPLLNKQKFHVQYDDLCEEVLKNGTHSVERASCERKSLEHNISDSDTNASHNIEDIFSSFLRALGELFTFNRKKYH